MFGFRLLKVFHIIRYGIGHIHTISTKIRKQRNTYFYKNLKSIQNFQVAIFFSLREPNAFARMKESTWPITIHYQISSFQVKPLRQNSCLMLSNPLASSSLPKRKVWKCFFLAYYIASVRTEPCEIFAKFSSLLAKFWEFCGS